MAYPHYERVYVSGRRERDTYQVARLKHDIAFLRVVLFALLIMALCLGSGWLGSISA